MIQNMPIALQLFSVRDELAADFRGTLQKVKDLGYEGVEFAGLHGRDPQEIRAMLDDIGLKGMSAHVPLDELLADIDKVVEDYKTLGCRYIAVPWLDEARRPGQPGYPQVLADIRAIGEACAAKGMTLLYHNHDFEFRRIPELGGKRIQEYLMESFASEELGFTLDTYWVQAAGGDVVEWIDALKGRLPCVHLKDMAMEKGGQVMAPVMEGNMNFPRILRHLEKAGTKYILVEQDTCQESPFVCLEKSYRNVSSLGYK